MFDYSSSEFGSSNKHFSKVKYGGKLRNQEVDSDYVWYLKYWTKTNGQTKVIGYEIENENENEIEKENEDETDKDSQYCMFLEKLTENGKSYMLEVSQNDATHFLKYEEDEESDRFDDSQTCIINIGDKVTYFEDIDDIQINQRANSRLHGEISTMKEISRRKKINKHKLMTVPHQGSTSDSCYQLLLNGTIPFDYGAFKYEGKLVKYEDKVTSSDSDLQILDNDQDFCEVNNNVSSVRLPKHFRQNNKISLLINASTMSTKTVYFNNKLKEKLIRILEKPYTQKEYEEQIEFANKKKPICRLLDLRGRSISSALKGVTKSLLDDSPGCFRSKLEGVQNKPQALNLLRMFRFWLEHVPNEDVFKPWLDKEILEIVPNKAGMDVVNPPA